MEINVATAVFQVLGNGPPFLRLNMVFFRCLKGSPKNIEAIAI